MPSNRTVSRVSRCGWPGSGAGSFAVRGSGSWLALLLGIVPVLLVGFLIVVVPGRAVSRSSVSSAVVTPAFSHIVVVVMENRSYSQVIGAPYIAGLARQGASMTDSHGVRHPSEPNYLALWSGSTQGLTDDSCPHTYSGSLGEQLLGAGKTVVGYNESMPSDGYTGCGSGGYARKHNPLADFAATATAAHNRTFAAFPTDFSTLPAVSFVAPNLCNDMHDCSVAVGDAWLKSRIDPYVQWAKTHNSLLVLTWDEDDFTSVNRIATIFAGQHVKPGNYPETINHYNVLHTIEAANALPQLGVAAAPITDIWDTSPSPTTTAPAPTTTAPAPTTTAPAPTTTAPAPTPTSTTPTPTSTTPTPSPTTTTTPPHLVQSAGATGGSTSTALTATLPNPSTAGDLLVLSAGVFAGPTNSLTSVTDSAGNLWKKINAWNVAGHYSDGEMWYAANVAATTTVTAHLGTAASLAIQVQDFAGVAATNPLDVRAGSSTTSATATSGPITPTNPGELLVGFTAGHGSTQTMTATPTGYTLQAQQTTTTPVTTLKTGYQVLSRASTTSFAASFPTAMYWAAGLAAFKPSSTSTAPPTTTSAAPSVTPTTTSSSATGPAGGPLRGAFYYPWFPTAWTQQGITPYTHYHPSAGFYASSDTGVIAAHIAAMRYAHLNFAIDSWWGPGSREDMNVPADLAGAAGTPFKWTLYYEAEGNTVSGVSGSPDPTVTQIKSDLAYIKTKYSANPNYLTIGGKPVIFVYGDGADNCATATRWKQANADGAFYVDLKVFAGYTTCADRPQAWHQYGPAAATDSQSGQAFSISPGFYKAGEATPRLARDEARWRTNIASMVASGAPMQLVVTFNEWGEGSSVEDATEWSGPPFGSYIEDLHNVLPAPS
jgi:Phosphoesterase family